MKKLLTITLSLVLAVSLLSACGGNTTSEETTSPDVAALKDTTTISAETPAEDEVESVDSTDSDSIYDESGYVKATNPAVAKQPVLSGSDLITVFENVYYANAIKEGTDDERLAAELGDLQLEALQLHMPEDYIERYIDWRPMEEDNNTSSSTLTSTEATTENKVTVSFTEVNETVYAAKTVNIRASYTTSSDKLGSLSAGSSIKRTGIGTGDAEGWSRVEFNGKTAYIASSYLTKTKPSTSSGSSSGSGKTSTTGNKSGTSSGNTSSGGSSSSGSSSSDSGPVIPGVEAGTWTQGEYIDLSGSEPGTYSGTGLYGSD